MGGVVSEIPRGIGERLKNLESHLVSSYILISNLGSVGVVVRDRLKNLELSPVSPHPDLKSPLVSSRILISNLGSVGVVVRDRLKNLMSHMVSSYIQIFNSWFCWSRGARQTEEFGVTHG